MLAKNQGSEGVGWERVGMDRMNICNSDPFTAKRKKKNVEIKSGLTLNMKH